MNQSNEVTERAAFEAWARETGLMVEEFGVLSSSSHCDTAWRAWQAARATLPQPSGEAVKCDIGGGGDGIHDPHFCHAHQQQFYGQVCPVSATQRTKPAPSDNLTKVLSELYGDPAPEMQASHGAVGDGFDCDCTVVAGELVLCQQCEARLSTSAANARDDYIKRKHVMGASYGGNTTLCVIVSADDYAMGGALYAIDCQVEREQGNSVAAIQAKEG